VVGGNSEGTRGAQRLAQALLRNVERIAERSAARMQELLPAYARVPRDELTPVVETNTRKLLLAMCDPDADSAASKAHFRISGETRARQGITSDEMLNAWRIGVEVVREHAHAAAEELGVNNEELLEFVVGTLQWGDVGMRASASAHHEAEVRELGRLVREQTALRRVATLVAQDVASDELFGAVAREVGTLFEGDYTRMHRYDPDSTLVTTMGTWAATGEHPPAPARSRTVPGDPIAIVANTGKPARVDDWTKVPGPIADFVRRELGAKSSVASPIVVNGSLWGALAVHSKRGPLPSDTASRLLNFTELVATAIANTSAQTEVSRLAEEQAALRRVATLVAQGGDPSDVFDIVAAELAGLLQADHVVVCRYEPGSELTALAYRGSSGEVPRGSRISHVGDSVEAVVWRTGRSARVEYEGARGTIAELARAAGVQVAVGAPVLVDGRLWGVAAVGWSSGKPTPADAEGRMAKFAELLGTAIANADSRDQLAASRARLVTEADDARRRVVRDLHDGAQQRLVHTIVTLKLAQRAIEANDAKTGSFIAEALEQAQQGNAELRELAHGLLPAVLTQGGLLAGVNTIVSRVDLPVEVDIPAGRFPAETEASAYFVVAEGLTNVMKHAHAARAAVRAYIEDGMLNVEVRDNGVGGADVRGRGLVGLGDRVTAIGGQLMLDSPETGGTLLAAKLPVCASSWTVSR
jgi:signal transduction histidine kinase